MRRKLPSNIEYINEILLIKLEFPDVELRVKNYNVPLPSDRWTNIGGTSKFLLIIIPKLVKVMIIIIEK